MHGDKFRILSIDGGGLRGIAAIEVLKKIEEISQEISEPDQRKKIHDGFDLFAGTSTGGIIAAALTVSDDISSTQPKYTLDDIAKIYRERGSEIFPTPRKLPIGFMKSLKNWVHPRFNDVGINNVFEKFFCEPRSYYLSDCVKPIFISSYDIVRNEPIYFLSRHVNNLSFEYSHTKNPLLFNICRATSAAPTYFPPHTFTYDNRNPYCVDGGVFINNPAIGALTDALEYAQDPLYAKDADKVFQKDDVYLLSIGTGTSTYEGQINPKKSQKWGQIKWAPHLINMMMLGNSQAVDHQVKQLLPEDNYHRIQFSIDPRFADMADSSEEAQKHWLKRLNEQVLDNPTQRSAFKNFLKKAGMV